MENNTKRETMYIAQEDKQYLNINYAADKYGLAPAKLSTNATNNDYSQEARSFDPS